jgi:recombinational DNA repair protein (RecF pathway)
LHDQVRWFFLEILSHSLHEEQPEETLFDLSKSTFQSLNDGCKNLPILPIQFLFRFCEVTGHGIQITEETKRTGFDILSGMPATSRSIPSNMIDGELCNALLEISIHDEYTLPTKQRRSLVNKLVQYLEIHAIPGKTLQSLEILQMIMQEPQQ